jgi:hypothetical protein
MLNHLAIAWEVFAGCVGFALRVGVVVACVHAMIESKPQRKRGNRYAGGPALSQQEQAEQSAYVAEMQRRERIPRRRRA